MSKSYKYTFVRKKAQISANFNKLDYNQLTVKTA